MLKPKVLPQVLNQASGENVKGTLLLNLEGSLVGSSTDSNNSSTVSAIVANIWASYEKASPDLNLMMIECEQGKVVVSRVHKFLLAVYGDKGAEFGMLKAKVSALSTYLQEPLSRVPIT